MSGFYDPRLVLLSYVVAVFASYTALDLAGRITSSQGRARIIWLLGGALALGIGIWSMHFTGMLAFILPMSISYDLPLVVLSLLVAIGASAGALFVMGRPVAGPRHLLVGGPIVGTGIVSMHYIGMAAMKMDATIEYDPFLVFLSIFIAIGASVIALWLAFQFRSEQVQSHRWLWLKIGSASIMGLAITGMHYTGMAAANFTHSGTTMADSPALSTLPLAIAIVGATMIILGFTLLSALFDRRFAAQSFVLAESAQRYQSLFQYHSDAVLTYDLKGNLHDANRAAVRIFGRDLPALHQDGINDLLTPQDAEAVALHLRAATAGEPQIYDLSLQRGNAEMALLNVRNVPIVIEDKLVGIYLIATDITERARAVEALQRNEGELRVLVERQQRLLDTIQELSTPVLPVHKQVLLLPLIGHLDSQRSNHLIEVLLTNVQRHHANAVIIDVTGVPIIDTAVASLLLQATSAARLLGAESILVGVSPEVAQTIVHLGVDISSLTTRSDLQAGVAYALSRRAEHTKSTTNQNPGPSTISLKQQPTY